MHVNFLKSESRASLRWLALICLLLFFCGQLQAAAHVHDLDHDHSDFTCAPCAHADHTLATSPHPPQCGCTLFYLLARAEISSQSIQTAVSPYAIRGPPKIW